VFIKSYETNVMIYKINACLGKQLLLKASNQNSTNNIVKMNRATMNIETDIVIRSNILILNAGKA
jgi:hypothetical protein